MVKYTVPIRSFVSLFKNNIRHPIDVYRRAALVDGFQFEPSGKRQFHERDRCRSVFKRLFSTIPFVFDQPPTRPRVERSDGRHTRTRRVQKPPDRRGQSASDTTRRHITPRRPLKRRGHAEHERTPVYRPRLYCREVDFRHCRSRRIKTARCLRRVVLLRSRRSRRQQRVIITGQRRSRESSTARLIKREQNDQGQATSTDPRKHERGTSQPTAPKRRRANGSNRE